MTVHERGAHDTLGEGFSEVAAGVAQDMRAPLNGISSAIQLVRLRAGDDPVVEKNVGRILREVERLHHMVSRLLEYGRLHAPVLTSGDADAVLDAVLASESSLLKGRALALQRGTVHPRLRCRIDGEQLAQAFRDIVVAAASAAPEGSDLTLTSSAPPIGGWRLRVHSGAVIAGADGRPSATELPHVTNLGPLGLDLPRRVVEAHGGTFAVASSPAQGMIVTVTLPSPRAD